MKTETGIRKLADEQSRALLRRLAYQVNRTSQAAGPDEIHNLRVSIRRFAQCLRTFDEFFPRGKQKKIRKRMKEIMKLAGEVRNRDIALEILKDAGVPAGSAAARLLSGERERAGRELASALKRWRRRDFSRRWRTQLGL
jgi:CHAD domain-containing protein